MKEILQTLNRMRLRVLLMNLCYFVLLLAAGVLIFLMDIGVPGYVLAVVAVAGYLLWIRPYRKKYVCKLRKAMLTQAICAGMKECDYQPKQGIEAEKVWQTGLIESGKRDAWLSREYVTARKPGLEAEMADVNFPVWEDGRNAMFNGCCIHLVYPGAEFQELTVRRSELDGLEVSDEQRKLLEHIGELIPGSLYVHMAQDCLDVLLRGRFVGFPINPLMAVSADTLKVNQLPEFEMAVRFGELCKKQWTGKR